MRIPGTAAKLGTRISSGNKPIKKAAKYKPAVPVLKEIITGEETTPLVPPDPAASTGARQRVKGDRPRYVPTDWDDSLPYGGKIRLARRKLPDSWPCFLLQVVVVGVALGMLYYAIFHTDHMHYHVTKVGAHLGHKELQATVGHKLLNGKGVTTNMTEAMEWFHKAAKQGHPLAAYNLAVGHLQGHKTSLQPGDAHTLLKEAAAQGVSQAVEVLERVCSQGHCDI